MSTVLPASRTTNSSPSPLPKEEFWRHARVGAGDHRRERRLIAGDLQPPPSKILQALGAIADEASVAFLQQNERLVRRRSVLLPPEARPTKTEPSAMPAAPEHAQRKNPLLLNPMAIRLPAKARCAPASGRAWRRRHATLARAVTAALSIGINEDQRIGSATARLDRRHMKFSRTLLVNILTSSAESLDGNQERHHDCHRNQRCPNRKENFSEMGLHDRQAATASSGFSLGTKAVNHSSQKGQGARLSWRCRGAARLRA